MNHSTADSDLKKVFQAALTATAAGPASAQGGTAVLQSGFILYIPQLTILPGGKQWRGGVHRGGSAGPEWVLPIEEAVTATSTIYYLQSTIHNLMKTSSLRSIAAFAALRFNFFSSASRAVGDKWAGHGGPALPFMKMRAGRPRSLALRAPLHSTFKIQHLKFATLRGLCGFAVQSLLIGIARRWRQVGRPRRASPTQSPRSLPYSSTDHCSPITRHFIHTSRRWRQVGRPRRASPTVHEDAGGTPVLPCASRSSSFNIQNPTFKIRHPSRPWRFTPLPSPRLPGCRPGTSPPPPRTMMMWVSWSPRSNRQCRHSIESPGKQQSDLGRTSSKPCQWFPLGMLLRAQQGFCDWRVRFSRRCGAGASFSSPG